MSIHGFFDKNVPDLKMPETGTNPLGIRYQGPVLSGSLGVRQSLERSAVNSPPSPTGIGSRLPPDPLLAAQRADVGRRESTDPVLRAHLGLPPLPDPYEQRRRSAERWEKERLDHVIP